MKWRKYGAPRPGGEVLTDQGMGAYALMACRAKKRRLPHRIPAPRHFLQSLDV
jgi:hypothetical protein